MKAKDLKNILVPLELCGKIFKIAFDFNSSIKPRNEKITLVEVGELLTEAMSDTEKANYIMEQLNKAMELASPNMEEGE